MIIWDYSHPQYNVFYTNRTVFFTEIVLISSPNAVYLNYFLYLCTQKRASLLTLGHQCKHHGPRLTADLSAERLRNGRQTTTDNSKK